MAEELISGFETAEEVENIVSEGLEVSVAEVRVLVTEVKAPFAELTTAMRALAAELVAVLTELTALLEITVAPEDVAELLSFRKLQL